MCVRQHLQDFTPPNIQGNNSSKQCEMIETNMQVNLSLNFHMGFNKVDLLFL